MKVQKTSPFFFFFFFFVSGVFFMVSVARGRFKTRGQLRLFQRPCSLATAAEHLGAKNTVLAPGELYYPAMPAIIVFSIVASELGRRAARTPVSR